MKNNKESNHGTRTEFTTEEKAYQESWKLSFDMSKHLTSLCTGSILILVAFLEKIFANPSWKGLVAVALCLFAFSIVFSVIAMLHITSTIRDQGYTKEVYRKSEYLSFSGGFVLFICGVGCLIAFTVKNLYE